MRRNTNRASMLILIVLAGAACAYPGLGPSQAQTHKPTASAPAKEPLRLLRMLQGAKLPAQRKIYGTHGKSLSYTARFDRVLSRKNIALGGRDFLLLEHPIDPGFYKQREDPAGLFRLTFLGLPVVRGMGPMSLWSGERLLFALYERAPWVIVDIGGKLGVCLFMIVDHLEEGNWMDLSVLKASSDGTATVWQTTTKVAFDVAVKGKRYALRAFSGEDGTHQGFEVLELKKQKMQKVGTLHYRQKSTSYTFKPVKAGYKEIDSMNFTASRAKG